MPRGPKGEGHAADAIGNAVKVMRIVTGEEVEILDVDDGKDPAAKALGKKGGAARDTTERRDQWTRPACARLWRRHFRSPGLRKKISGSRGACCPRSGALAL